MCGDARLYFAVKKTNYSSFLVPILIPGPSCHTNRSMKLSQVKALIEGITAACARPADKIDRQALRKQAHQLADFCKTGETSLTVDLQSS